MKKLDEHSQWEDEWARAFEDARQAPSPNVWNNIHAVQADKEADKFRKRAFFYKWLAAASVFISICSGVIFFLNSGQEQERGLAVQSSQEEVGMEENPAGNTGTITPPVASGESGTIAGRGESSGQFSADAPAGKSETGTRGTATGKGTVSQQEEYDISSALAAESGEEHRKQKAARNTQKDQANIQLQEHGKGSQPPVQGGGNFNGAGDDGSARPAAVLAMEENKPEEEYNAEGEETGFVAGATGEVIEKTPSAGTLAVVLVTKRDVVALDFEKHTKVDAEIRKLWVASNFLKKEKAGSVPRYMLGASLASNNFNANYLDKSPEVANLAHSADAFKATSLSPLANARVTDWDNEQKSVVSVAGAVQGAAWLSKKWVLQGGVQYGNYKTENTASTYTDASGNMSYPLHFANYSEDKMQSASLRTARAASSVSATNSFAFLSVPLSIGYVVVDRKLSLLLSPGISSEFFLSNKLSSDDGDALQTYTVSNGEESPFNLVHFRGLISAQLFYKMSENYMISLEPGFQQAISDFNKSDSFFSSRPSNMSIAAGFRYIFH